MTLKVSTATKTVYAVAQLPSKAFLSWKNRKICKTCPIFALLIYAWWDDSITAWNMLY